MRLSLLIVMATICICQNYASLIELTGANPLDLFHEDGASIQNGGLKGHQTKILGLPLQSLPNYETGQASFQTGSTASPEEEENTGGEGGAAGEGEQQVDVNKDARETAEDNQEGDDDATGADEEESSSSSSESESLESLESQGGSAESGVQAFVGGRPGSAVPAHMIPEIGPLPDPFHMIQGAHVLIPPPQTGRVRSAPLAIFPYSSNHPYGQHPQPMMIVQRLNQVQPFSVPEAQTNRQLRVPDLAEMAMTGPAVIQSSIPAAALPEVGQTTLDTLDQSTHTGQGKSEQPRIGGAPNDVSSPFVDPNNLTTSTAYAANLGGSMTSPQGVFPSSVLSNERFLIVGTDGPTRLHSGSDAASPLTETTSQRNNPSSNPRVLYKRSVNQKQPEGKSGGQNGSRRGLQERFRPRRIQGSQKKLQQRKLSLSKLATPIQSQNVRAMFAQD